MMGKNPNTAKVKICHVAASDITLKFMLFNQLKFCHDQGYDTYAVSAPGKFIKDISAAGITVKTIPFKRKISPFFDLVTFFKLYAYFKKEQFDIVHTHTFKPDLYGQIAAKWAGVPIIMRTSHGFPFGQTSSSTKKTFYLLLEKFLNRYSDLILSIGRHIIAASIEEKIAPPEKLGYLGRDIDTQRFDPARFSAQDILEKKKQLGIPADQKVIGIVARLVKEKGYLELFQAFKLVLPAFPDTVLVVVGPHEPEKKDALDLGVLEEYGLENQVIFLGERKDVDEIYPLMDIFVLPTHMEGLGASILEAEAEGRPVIASNTGGVPETIDDGVTGILTPVKNVAKLAEAMAYLLGNEEIAKTMGQKGREKIIREFSINIVLSRLGQAYQNMIAKKLGGFDRMWQENYNATAKNPAAKDHEVSYWSESGLEYYKKYFQEYVSVTRPAKKILDVGCGLGIFSKLFQDQGHDVFGLDYSPEVLARAKARPENAGIHFSLGDIYQMPYADGEFDVLFCSGLFQCISDHQKALQECRRVLKPGGQLIIMTLNRFSLTRIANHSPVKTYSPYGLKKELQTMGFSNITLQGIYFLPGLTAFILRRKMYRWLNSIFPISIIFSHSFCIIAYDQKNI